MPDLLRRAAALVNLLLAGALAFLAIRLVIMARFSTLLVVLVGSLLILGVLSAVAARGLWRGTLAGAFLSLVVQGTQLIQGETRPLTYTSSLPMALVVGLTGSGSPHLRATTRPRLEITPDDDPAVSWVGVNLPALLVVVVASGVLLGSRRPAPPV